MKSALLVSLPTLMSSMHSVLTGRLLDKTPASAAVTVHKKQQKLAQLAQSDSSPGLTDADWDQVGRKLNLTEWGFWFSVSGTAAQQKPFWLP